MIVIFIKISNIYRYIKKGTNFIKNVQFYQQFCILFHKLAFFQKFAYISKIYIVYQNYIFKKINKMIDIIFIIVSSYRMI